MNRHVSSLSARACRTRGKMNFFQNSRTHWRGTSVNEAALPIDKVNSMSGERSGGSTKPCAVHVHPHSRQHSAGRRHRVLAHTFPAFRNTQVTANNPSAGGNGQSRSCNRTFPTRQFSKPRHIPTSVSRGPLELILSRRSFFFFFFYLSYAHNKSRGTSAKLECLLKISYTAVRRSLSRLGGDSVVTRGSKGRAEYRANITTEQDNKIQMEK